MCSQAVFTSSTGGGVEQGRGLAITRLRCSEVGMMKWVEAGLDSNGSHRNKRISVAGNVSKFFLLIGFQIFKL